MEPYLSSPEKWKKHFLEMSTDGHKNKGFYMVRQKQTGNGDDIIKMVTPTQDAIERAKASISKFPETTFRESTNHKIRKTGKRKTGKHSVKRNGKKKTRTKATKKSKKKIRFLI